MKTLSIFIFTCSMLTSIPSQASDIRKFLSDPMYVAFENKQVEQGFMLLGFTDNIRKLGIANPRCDCYSIEITFRKTITQMTGTAPGTAEDKVCSFADVSLGSAYPVYPLDSIDESAQCKVSRVSVTYP